MGREAMIKADMEAVGTYNPIFDKTIKALARTERELSRAEKTWRENGAQLVAKQVNKAGAEYLARDPYWSAVDKLRADVQSLRTQLGLTPKSLKAVQTKLEETASGRRSRLAELMDAAHEHAMTHAGDYQAEVDGYVNGVLSGETVACEEIVLACKRYVRDLENPKWDFRFEPACEIISIIETMMCHQQGEFLDGTPLRGTPFLLLPYHKFIVANIMGFYKKGTQLRRFTEAQDFIPRKNIKTTFAAALAWALALYYAPSGSKVYEVGGALKQALEGFDFIKYNSTIIVFYKKVCTNQTLAVNSLKCFYGIFSDSRTRPVVEVSRNLKLGRVINILRIKIIKLNRRYNFADLCRGRIIIAKHRALHFTTVNKFFNNHLAVKFHCILKGGCKFLAIVRFSHTNR